MPSSLPGRPSPDRAPVRTNGYRLPAVRMAAPPLLNSISCLDH
jgi:hypothetical protein